MEFNLVFAILLTVKLIQAVDKYDIRCETYARQCQRYTLLTVDSGAMSWSAARGRCQDLGSEIAYFVDEHTAGAPLSEQFYDMQQSCQGKIHGTNTYYDQSCWFGASRSPTNQDQYSFVEGNITLYADEGLNWQKLGIKQLWSCVAQDPTDCEPDDKFADPLKPQGTPAEDYLALFQSRYYYVSDFPEHGNPDNEAFSVRGVLCMNVDFDPAEACFCECDECHIHGDPHIYTLDENYYHPMGECVYHYATPCSANDGYNQDYMPFDVSGSHVACFKRGASCLEALYVSLFSPDDWTMPQLIVSLAHVLDDATGLWTTEIAYQDCGTISGVYQCQQDLVGQDITVGVDNQFYTSTTEPWCFVVNEPSCTKTSNVDSCSVDDYYWEFRLYTTSPFELMRVAYRDLTGYPQSQIYLSTGRIIMTHCALDYSCGLCGYWNHNATDEWVMQDVYGEPMFAPRRPGNDDPEDFNDPIWTEAQMFAQSWINENLLFTTTCDTSEIAPACDTDQWPMCPTSCSCLEDQDGDGVFSDVVNNVAVAGEAQTCQYDLCVCIDMDYATADSYGVEAEFGWDTASLVDSGALIDYATYSAFLRLIDSTECIDIVRCACSVATYCPVPDYRPIVCEVITLSPTPNPTSNPTYDPTPEPVEDPTPYPTSSPTDGPTEYPTPEPTLDPTPDPVEPPTPYPTANPTDGPTEYPTPEPTADPTPEPVDPPTPQPTNSTEGPTDYPTPEPTFDPTPDPTPEPTTDPTPRPTPSPTFPSPTADPTCDSADGDTDSFKIRGLCYCTSGHNRACECEGKMTSVTLVYLGSSEATISFYYSWTNNDELLCRFPAVQYGQEITCTPHVSDRKTFHAKAGLTLVDGDGRFNGQVHTSCSQNILATKIDGMPQLLVVGWADRYGCAPRLMQCACGPCTPEWREPNDSSSSAGSSTIGGSDSSR